jgi:hypothetical protein
MRTLVLVTPVALTALTAPTALVVSKSPLLGVHIGVSFDFFDLLLDFFDWLLDFDLRLCLRLRLRVRVRFRPCPLQHLFVA